MKFSDLCDFCEKMQSTSPAKLQKEVLKTFVERCRANATSGQAIFSIFRLLVPDIDRSRGAYGIKEAKLGELYVQMQQFAKGSTNAELLIKYKATAITQTSSKDFADIVCTIMRQRAPKKSCGLPVDQINEFLDKLSKLESGKNKDMISILQPLVRQLTAVEQKWLVRIILRNVRCGAGQKPLLKAYHPDAQELYNVCYDLEKVCVTLFDLSNRSFALSISLFKPFSPMLADQSNLNQIVSKMGNKMFYVETKLDGERTQIHIDGDRYAYFTRRGYDYSDRYGSNSSCGSFTPRFHSLCRLENVTNCILDGEMVAWNPEGEYIVTKGGNVDVKNLTPNGRLIPVFYPFDIVLLNGEVLANRPLKERIKILETVVQKSTGVLHFPDREEVNTKPEVIDLLNDAIDRREEGLVLKDPESIYKPNARKGGWVKVKPEYVNGMMDHLDLLVIGCYYGNGKKKNIISRFLLGVAVPSSESDKTPSEFWSVARVGSGYSDEQLGELEAQLDGNLQKWDDNAPPPMIRCGKEKPQFWIEPSKSIVLEVKATEIVSGKDYKVGSTLRFARVAKFRNDRSWLNSMTLAEFRAMKINADGKLSFRHVAHEDNEPAAKRSRVGKQSPTVHATFRPTNVSDVVLLSDCFKRKEICVLPADDQEIKPQLEKKITAGGGTLTQYWTNKTYCIVAPKDNADVKKLGIKREFDVVRPIWIDRCLAAKKLMIYKPDELRVITDSTLLVMSKYYDDFGNSLTDPCTVDDVKSILERVQEIAKPNPLTNFEIADLEFNIFGGLLKYSIFRICVVYVDKWETISDSSSPVISSELDMIAMDLRMYGAELVDRFDERVTHVVCDPSGHPERLPQWKEKRDLHEKKFYLVGSSWVTDSIKKGSTADEISYQPTCRTPEGK